MAGGLIEPGRGPYTAAEIQRIQEQLWRLLGKQTQRYTMEESSSVPVETAQELLSSLLYCLRLALKEKPDRRDLLLRGEYETLVQEGLDIVEREIQMGLRRYQYLCSHPPVVTNRAYRDTVGGILSFFRSYQPQFFAHLADCSIDYQLFLPVSERLQGISYLNAYLMRLMLENQLLRPVPKKELEALLQAAYVDYEDLLVNLYEPVLQNGIARAMLDQDVTRLSVSAAERETLQMELSGAGENQRRQILKEAAQRLCESLGLQGAAERQYVTQSAETLLPRLNTALLHHTIEGLFVTF